MIRKQKMFNTGLIQNVKCVGKVLLFFDATIFMPLRHVFQLFIIAPISVDLFVFKLMLISKYLHFLC